MSFEDDFEINKKIKPSNIFLRVYYLLLEVIYPRMTNIYSLSNSVHTCLITGIGTNYQSNSLYLPIPMFSQKAMCMSTNYKA